MILLWISLPNKNPKLKIPLVFSFGTGSRCLAVFEAECEGRRMNLKTGERCEYGTTTGVPNTRHTYTRAIGKCVLAGGPPLA